MIGDTAHLVVLDREGDLSVTTVLFNIIPEIPEDILARSPVQLGRGTVAYPADRSAPHSHLAEGAWMAESISAGPAGAVLAWWTAPRELNAVLLDQSGVGAELVRLQAPGHGLGFPKSLLERALAELGLED